MSFTKVNAAGIGTTQPLTLSGVNLSGVVTASGLYVTGVSTFTGNVSIAGTLTYEDVTNVDSVGLITARSGIQITGGSGLDLTGSLGIITATTYKVGAAVTISSGGVEVVGVTTTQTLKVGTAGTTLNTTALGDVTTLGRFGVGVASPDALVHLRATSPFIRFTDSVDDTHYAHIGYSDGSIYVIDADAGNNRAGSAIQFKVDNQEHLRIDSSGRLLVGTSSSRTGIQVQLEGTSYATSSASLTRNENAAGGPLLWLNKSRGTANGSFTIVQADDNLGTIDFGGSDGSSDRTAARIQGFVDGTPGSADMPGRLVFSTTADGASSPTERMRIDSSGNVGIAEDSPLTYRPGSGIPTLVLRGDSPSYTARSGAVVFLSQDGTTSKTQLYANTGFQINSQTATPITFHTDATERARIDSSGRLLVGTSTAQGSTIEAKTASVTSGSSAYDQKAFIASIPYATTNITSTMLASYDGSIHATNIGYAYDGSRYYLTFGTSNSAASGTVPTEHFRINGLGTFHATTDGNFTGATQIYNEIYQTFQAVCLYARNTNTNPYGYQVYYDVAKNNTSNEFLYCGDSSAQRAVIRSNGGLANYQSNNVNLCDEREKKNIETLDSTWSCLKNWDLKKFHYNEDADTDDKRYGVIAQQVAPHCPEVITDWVKQKAEDAVLDEDGNVVTPAVEEVTRMGVKEQQMMWMAIKALQEAQTRIETLEAEVAALKGA